ncbi:hypothetical protein [Sphingomonas radiodurans]|uniref:hypothetical protein n=1 Tax=Sphingomonas radiodurans TaxID=2890321 RepID=UPI001E2DD88B|nr:hypothetical protein [Sphingomonas radiodurans]WBH15194.1 hypothetical protein LLW23_10015 [Sphingomonas radiodurans]
MRKVLGVIVGVVAAIATITVIELISHTLFPPPTGIDMNDPLQASRFVDLMSMPAKISVVAAWFLGAAVGAFAALNIARWSVAGWFVAATVVTGAISSFMMIPHPMWMQVAGILLPIAGVLMVARIVPSTINGST